MKDITPEGIKKEIENGVEEGRTIRYTNNIPLNEIIEGLEEYVKDPKIDPIIEIEKFMNK